MFNDAELFEQIDNTPLTEGPMGHLVKTDPAVQRR